MKKLTLMTAALGFVLATPALAADEKVTSESKTKTTMSRDDDGDMERKSTTTTKNTNAAGTTTKTSTKVEVEADADGDSESKVTRESSTDPKGLLNKSTAKETETTKTENGVTEKEYKKEVDGKTVAHEKDAASSKPAR